MISKLNATAAQEMSAADFQRHRDEEVRRRGDFAQAYPSIASALDRTVIANLPPGTKTEEVIIPTRGVNEQEEEKIGEVRKVHRQMAEIGVKPASIVNLHPWPIVGDGIFLKYRTIPACPIGQAYSHFVIKDYGVDIEDKAGRFGASAVTPITMANDLANQLEPLNRGGLVRYIGDHAPGEKPLLFPCPECGAKRRQGCRNNNSANGEALQGYHSDRMGADEYQKEMDMMATAKRKQLAFYKMLHRDADKFHQSPQRVELKNITDMHRLAGQWMVFYRFLKVAPPWISETRDEDMIPPRCEGCGAEATGSVFRCLNCGFILDPIRAFQLGEIEDSHQSLKRLTREQLDVLGLDYVLTLSEYQSARRDAALRKPEPPEPPKTPAPSTAITVTEDPDAGAGSAAQTKEPTTKEPKPGAKGRG